LKLIPTPLARTIVAASLMFSVQSVVAVELPKPQSGDPEVQGVPSASTSRQASSPSPCHWWQLHCDDIEIEGLPPEAPRTGMVITIDLSTNTLFLVKDGSVVSRSPAATGTERVLRKGSRVWAFHTPRGHLRVLRKIIDPVWRKPDWAYVEAGKPVPPPDSPRRLVRNHLGRFALDLGDGILIHGTDETDSIGRRASHGCVRLPDNMLAQLWKTVPVGTDVFIYESAPPAMTSNGGPEHHSDLDY
jgi:hypothetical protein